MSEDHLCSFTADVDRLSSVIEGYKSQTFQATLKIMGIYQHDSENLMDVASEKELDVFLYVGKDHKKSIIRLAKFDSSLGFERRKSVLDSPCEFDKLMLHLMSQSRSSSGCEIILDGSNNGKMNEKRVRCYYGKKYSTRKKIYAEDQRSYRDDSITNLRKNNRAKGKTLSRRSTSKRPDICDIKCKVFFIIGYDNTSYYIKCGYGNNLHEGHGQTSSSLNSNVSSKMFNETQKTVIELCEKAKTPGSTDVDLVNVQDTQKFTRHQVHYMKRLVKQVKNLSGDQNISDTDSLITYFESLHHCRYVILYNDAQSLSEGVDGKLIYQEVKDKEEDSCVHSHFVCFDENKKNDVFSFCTKQRNAIGADPSSKMVLGTAWTHKHLRRIARAFGDVLFVDATEGTNDEERPLLTVSVRTSLMKQVVVLRAVLPNNQRWVYRWFFQDVISSLLGKSFSNQVKVVLTDGDWNEMAAVDEAFNSHFKIAIRQRCGWHIVDRGWARHLDRVVSCKSLACREDFYRIKRTIQCWMYSWMKSSILTEDEFVISKSLFFSYLHSDVVKSKIGSKGCFHIAEFVRKHVLCHESWFAFFKRKGVRHFENYTNTPHEGTMNALKYCSSPALPCHSLLQTHQVITFQDEKKQVMMEKESMVEFLKKKVWSSTATSKYVTTIAESILINTMAQVESYASLKLSDVKYLVTRSVEKPSDSLLPKFRRMYVVVREDKCLKCSCKFHERNGLPCPHTGHVMKKHFVGWNGFTMYDVSIFWWSIKLYAASKIAVTKDMEEISAILDDIEQNDSKGVYVHDSVIETQGCSNYQYGLMSDTKYRSSYIPEEFFNQPRKATQYCVNYSEAEIAESLSQYSNYHFGIAQHSHPDSSSDEESFSKVSSNDLQFEDRHDSFVELNLKSSSHSTSAYFALKDSFSTLVKWIDGDEEAINKWKGLLQDGVAEATKKIRGEDWGSDMESCSSSSSASVYVSAYKGQSGLKKRKRRKLLKTSDYK